MGIDFKLYTSVIHNEAMQEKFEDIKEQSEAVKRKRTDNTMVNGINNDLQNTTQKTND